MTRSASVPASPDDDAAPPERPLGLSLLIWLFWFWAGAVVLVFLGFAVGDGPVMLDGRAVPRLEALRSVLPSLLPMGMAAAGAALALGLDRPWARPAVLLPFVLAALAPGLSGRPDAGGDLFLTALLLAPVVGLLVWYLYFAADVEAHFNRLRGARGDAGAGTATGA